MVQRERAGTGRVPSGSGTVFPSQPIPRGRVRQSVIDYVKQLIFDGQLAVGERVPQDEIATALNLSNTPVREAIIALEHEGLVSIEHYRGAFVNRFRAEDVHGQYELFALLWGWAIGRAVTRAAPETAQVVAQLAKQMKKTNTGEQTYQLITAFADEVERAGGSPAWRALIDALPRLLPSSKYYDLVPGAIASVAKWAAKAATALAANDQEAAMAAMESMMRDQGDALIAELRRRGLLEPT